MKEIKPYWCFVAICQSCSAGTLTCISEMSPKHYKVLRWIMVLSCVFLLSSSSFEGVDASTMQRTTFVILFLQEAMFLDDFTIRGSSDCLTQFSFSKFIKLSYFNETGFCSNLWDIVEIMKIFTDDLQFILHKNFNHLLYVRSRTVNVTRIKLFLAIRNSN